MADSANSFRNLADTEPRILHENLGISGHKMRNEMPLVTSKDLRRLADWLFELYVKAHPGPRDVIVIDIDATDDSTHGQQQLSFFHGYYEEDMYHPEVQQRLPTTSGG